MMCFSKECPFKQDPGPQVCPAANNGCDGFTKDADRVCYIAGKISGDKEYRKKFSIAKAALVREGFSVLNPADLPAGMTPAEYMRICFAMMDTADIVAFLPDWYGSRGARLENDWCQYVGKKTIYLEHMTFYKKAVE